MSSDLLKSFSGGKKWTELDLWSARNGSGSPVAADNGPEEGLKILELVQGAKKIGEADINGVPTTRYSGTLPAAGEVFGVELHFAAPQVDVWIDAKDRVRRMHLVVEGALNKDEGSSTTSMTIDYVAFGQVPKIELPHSDEVFNATGEIESQVQSAAESH